MVPQNDDVRAAVAMIAGRVTLTRGQFEHVVLNAPADREVASAAPVTPASSSSSTTGIAGSVRPSVAAFASVSSSDGKVNAAAAGKV